MNINKLSHLFLKKHIVCTRLHNTVAKKIFKIIQKEGNIPDSEMRKVFNLGVGLVLVVNADTVESFLNACKTASEQAFVIGSVTKK